MAKKNRKRRLIIGGVIAAIIIINVVISIQGSNGDATEVQADLAYLGNISEKVNASGRLQPKTKVDITAEVSAQIIAVYVSEGDRVVKGQRLILLDTVQLNADVAQSRFSLDEIRALTDAARAQYVKDSLEFNRQSRLFSEKLISETEFTNARLTFENSQANFQAMKAQVHNARARLDKVEDNLAKTLLTAPMDGIVTYLNAEVGEIAQAQTSYTQGKVLMTIADLSIFEVEVEVDETEIARVRIGQPVEIRIDAHRDTAFAGTVVEIGNSAIIENQGTQDYSTNFQVKIRFDETDIDIRPGMSATVDITTADAEDVVLIPYASVIVREFDPDSLELANNPDKPNGDSESDPGDDTTKAFRKKEKIKKTGAFIIADGLARFVEISTGIADDYNVVALHDINPGDTVISGTFKTLRDLKNGEAVQIDELSLEKMRESL